MSSFEKYKIVYKRLVQKVKSIPYLINSKGVLSYAQVGEDKILHFLFSSLNITKPTYLDIGTNDPVRGSNTYFFYTRGSRGVCVEPNPELYTKIIRKRPLDKVLNIGIGLNEVAEASFYIFEETGWSTFSKEEAEYRNANGQPYLKEIKMPLKNINDIIKLHCAKTPDLLSIDVEGLDFEIIKSLQFELYAPQVIVLETLRYGNSSKQEKQQDLIDYVLQKGYTIYADTFVNTIFLKKP